MSTLFSSISRFLFAALALPASAILVSACEDSDSDRPPSLTIDASVDVSRPDTGSATVTDAAHDAPVDAAGDVSDAADACARTGLASFKISNLPAGFVLPTMNSAVAVTGPQAFDSDTGSFLRGSGGFGTALAGSNADSPRVLHVTDFTLEASGEFVISGSRPVIIVATGSVEIAGTIRTPQDNTTSGAGGRPSPVHSGNCGSGAGCPTKGLGPGGGGLGAPSGVGGGGAGYCGLGGLGASGGGAKGPTWGNPEIIPLVGGASGGSASYGNGPSGPGGGALQIVAATAIVIKNAGIVTMAGAGGYGGATGAGSGGSILLEAPKVTVDGVLAANGGGGGGSSGGSGIVNIGEWGRVTSTPAKGGGAVGEKAGDGSGGIVIDGMAGMASLYGTGGGGGAGRIRINTACGLISLGVGAVISPAQSTACATTGTLAKP